MYQRSLPLPMPLPKQRYVPANQTSTEYLRGKFNRYRKQLGLPIPKP